MSGTNREKQFITSATLAANYTSDPIPCRGYDEIALQLELAGTSTPVGSMFIQGRETPSGDWADLPIDRAAGAGVTHVAGEANIDISNGTTNSRILVTIASPPRHMRVRWARGSGGSATGLNGYYTARKWNLP